MAACRCPREERLSAVWPVFMRFAAVAVLARLGAEWQARRTAERAKLAAAPEEVKAARRQS